MYKANTMLITQEVKVTVMQVILIMLCLFGTVYIIFKETESPGRNCLMTT